MASRRSILLADDEHRFAEALRRGLMREGFEVTVVHDGAAALEAASAGDFDALLLDLMLPGLSGYRVVEQLRARGSELPVLMLTAKDGEYDEADAFDLGVDDYLTKPFSTVVLLARLRALLRRRAPLPSTMLDIGALRIDRARHVCDVDGTPVPLTAREFSLVAYLAEHAGVPVSKRELLDEVWDDPELDVNAVEVCVMAVRRKIGSERIDTVRGVGYRMIPA